MSQPDPIIERFRATVAAALAFNELSEAAGRAAYQAAFHAAQAFIFDETGRAHDR